MFSRYIKQVIKDIKMQYGLPERSEDAEELEDAFGEEEDTQSSPKSTPLRVLKDGDTYDGL